MRVLILRVPISSLMEVIALVRWDGKKKRIGKDYDYMMALMRAIILCLGWEGPKIETFNIAPYPNRDPFLEPFLPSSFETRRE